MMKTRRTFRLLARHRLARELQLLEARTLLDATGFLWGDAPQLTLSFAEEGTNVAGMASSLRGAFDGLADTSVWQGTILRTFQSWASLTNGDIGVVNDSGVPFGVAGLPRDDGRFGDIRIAAVPLADDLLAVAVPSDTLFAGTWSGDVMFNSSVAWSSLDDLYSVALHEAGHVFGLEHSDDPASPMHVHGISSAIKPTPDDIAALVAVHGARMHDLNEYDTGGNDGAGPGFYIGNENLADATRLQESQDGALGAEGSAPAIAHGDITSATDVDFYWFDGLSDYSGPVTVTVRSAGMSLVAPHAELLNEQGEVIIAVASQATAGDELNLQLSANDRHARYYVRVEGGLGVFGVGHYSVSVSFDEVVTVDHDRLERFAGREFRFMTAHQIRDLFELGADSLFNDDDHADDEPAESGELNTAVGYLEDTRYEAVGSIADSLDVDHYRFKSPLFAAGQNVPLTISTEALESGGLIPRVELLDGDLHPVAVPIVANGNGRLVVQLPETTSDDEYVLRVGAAANAGVHATGNYKLAIVFGGRAVELVDFAVGSVSDAAPVQLHALHVGQSQLVHLLLDLSAADVNDGAWATIYDAQGGVRGRIGAQGGDTRSATPIMLEPGAYTVQVAGVSLVGGSLGEALYRLRGAVISDPLGPILHDPTFDPVYLCPGQSDVYCYPGGVQSPSPYLWSDFIQTEPSGQAPADPNDLFNNWWNWFWSLQPGDTNGDQSVSVDDLNNVRNNFGESGYAPLGDTDGDGVVTLEDLNRVRNNFGASRGAPVAAPLAHSLKAAVSPPATATSPSVPASAVDAVFAAYLSGGDTTLDRRRTRLR